MQTKFIIKDKTGEIYGDYKEQEHAELDLLNFEDNDPENPFYTIVRVEYTDVWECEVQNTPDGVYAAQVVNGKWFEAVHEDQKTAVKIVCDAAWQYFISLK